MRLAPWALLAVLAVAPAAAQTIIAADYAQPVTRYGHDALGPGHEWGALDLGLQGGQRLRFSLPETLVYEDIAPHLADLNGDGFPEVVVVESSLTQGSRIAVYSATGRIAATAAIGSPNRWLALVGIADLDGDGTAEIAYVETPHRDKLLKILRLNGNDLTLVAQAAGLTNHRFGDGFFQGGIAICAGKATIVTAYADWSRIIGTLLSGGKLLSADLGRYSGPQSIDAALACR